MKVIKDLKNHSEGNHQNQVTNIHFQIMSIMITLLQAVSPIITV